MTSIIELPSARPWIGGSSIAALLGIPNPGNRTPLTEFYRLTGKAPELDEEDHEFFEGRKALEPYVAHKLRKHKVFPSCFNVRYTDAEHNWLRAEIDAETDDENDEFKTASEFVREFGEEGSDDFPMYMAAQTQFGLMIRPKPLAFVNVLQGFEKLKRFPVRPDEEMQAVMRSRAIEFMERHVIPGIAPEPINLDDARLRWPRSVERSILASAGMIAALERMAALDAQAKELEAEKDGLKLVVQKELGDNEAALGGDGKPVSTWKSNRSSFLIDTEKLIESYESRLLITDTVGDTANWISAERKRLTKEKIGNRPLVNKLKKRG